MLINFSITFYIITKLRKLFQKSTISQSRNRFSTKKLILKFSIYAKLFFLQSQTVANANFTSTAGEEVPSHVAPFKQMWNASLERFRPKKLRPQIFLLSFKSLANSSASAQQWTQENITRKSSLKYLLSTHVYIRILET